MVFCYDFASFLLNVKDKSNVNKQQKNDDFLYAFGLCDYPQCE